MSTLPVRAESAEPRSFWQRRFVQDVLPFMSSLSLHVGLVVLGFVTYKAVVIMTTPDCMAPNVIPAAMSDALVELNNVPDFAKERESNSAVPTLLPALSDSAAGLNANPTKLAALAPMGDNQKESDDSIALGSQKLFGRGPGNNMSTSGEGGDPFGTPGGPGTRIGGTFIGCPPAVGNARRIVYLCDASGTMMNVFDNLRVELRKAVDTLKPVQSYNVMFFQGDDVFSLDKNGLVAATPQSKRNAYDFLDRMVARSGTNPMPAIRAAFAQKPQLIYVLTDGFDAVSSFDEVVQEFRKLNPRKEVKVNTILIRSADDPELEAVLKKIADENGGVFKAVNQSEFR